MTKQEQPFPPQQQEQQPGLRSAMNPLPESIRPTYRGSGKLAGKVALITGGDSGIGRAVAIHFAKEGAHVAILYKNYDTDRDLSIEELIDTQHTSGSTFDPDEAEEQGLVYTPPHDPPVVPSDRPDRVEIGIGFVQSMEEIDPNDEDLPDNVAKNDVDLEDDIMTALRYNSETTNLSDDIHVRVRNGIVRLYGTVSDLQDSDLVEDLVRDLDGVVDVINNLDVAAIM